MHVPLTRSTTTARSRTSAHALFLTTILLGALLPAHLHADEKNTAEQNDLQRETKISTVCLLNGEKYENQDYALSMIAQACERPGNDLVVAPHMPFLSFRTDHAAQDLAPFAKLADEHNTYLAVSLMEKAGDKTYAASVLLNRQGEQVFKYRKTHALPDDNMALGDELKVVKTDFGTLGATITTDFYFPEIYEVLRMKGADLLLWHHYPERMRQHHMWGPLLFTRPRDTFCHFVTAHYADPGRYLTNRYPSGPGSAWGRSQIITPSGVPLADTAYQAGVATAEVKLHANKKPDSGVAERTFFVNVKGNRDIFTPVAQPWQKPDLPDFEKRTATIAVTFMDWGDIWSNGEPPTKILELLDKAAKGNPDLVLFTEQRADIDHESTLRGFEQIASKAREMNCYIMIGGIGTETSGTTAYLWNRQGEIVFKQPIYWPSGLDQPLAYYDTDFARISAHTCGDLYAPFLDRTLALQGVELLLDPSMMWGPDGRTNNKMIRARAIDNGMWYAVAHLYTSDPGLRSVIVDPYGSIRASTDYLRDDVAFKTIDFSRQRFYYAGRNPNPRLAKEGMPDRKPGWREMIFNHRRPELYKIIPTMNDVIQQYWPKERKAQTTAQANN